MHVAITGVNGFIGKSLVSYLKKRGECTVYGFDDDVTDAESVKSFTCNTLVHLAGVNRSDDELSMLDANVLGTYNIARHCLKNDIRLIVAGSVKTAGIYGASKQIGKSIVTQLASNGLYGTYIHLCNVYGPNCKPFYNSFATTIMYSIANGIEFKHRIKNKHETLRLVHVRDVCQGIECLLSKVSFEKFGSEADPGSATECFITIEDFVRLCEGLRPHKPIRQRDENLILQTLQSYCDNAFEAI